MFAFLGVSGVVVGHCHYCAVVFHDDCREFEGNLKFLAEGDEKVEFLGKSEDGSCFGMGRRCSDRCLFNAAVVECASGTMEGDGVAGVSFTVGIKEVRRLFSCFSLCLFRMSFVNCYLFLVT